MNEPATLCNQDSYYTFTIVCLFDFGSHQSGWYEYMTINKQLSWTWIYLSIARATNEIVYHKNLAFDLAGKASNSGF